MLSPGDSTCWTAVGIVRSLLNDGSCISAGLDQEDGRCDGSLNCKPEDGFS